MSLYALFGAIGITVAFVGMGAGMVEMELNRSWKFPGRTMMAGWMIGVLALVAFLWHTVLTEKL